jgi:hypothetical protein
MVYPTDSRDDPRCVAIGNHIASRDNLANGSAGLSRIFGPSLPMSPQESNLLQQFQDQAQREGTSPFCADMAATAVIDVARMKMLANRACQTSSQGLINQIGPELVNRAAAWKPKVDRACRKD